MELITASLGIQVFIPTQASLKLESGAGSPINGNSPALFQFDERSLSGRAVRSSQD
jgi:hypothetical protein